ncbi:hypothetical protein RCCGEPOP_00837 [Rhizobium sp. Pop5]|nr:hypothetical protein RCCGEPOP_00837 [Rhizobium sp. Pop5]
MQRQAVVFNGQEVGIAVPAENRLKFIAVRFNVIDLDNRLFDTVTESGAPLQSISRPAVVRLPLTEWHKL